MSTMRLLQHRVPLTLLLDLAEPPDAEELYRTEGGLPGRTWRRLASAGEPAEGEPVRLS